MIWIIILISVCLSLIATGVFRQLAIRWNIVDIPNTSLKNHGSVKPYLGGLGIFSAFLLGICLAGPHP
jgi:UDP-N-acetylmuramyl pentapeptide phosphotransferase/UDP-N-acetylglucosamine-1-phosphate transferase